MRWRGTRRPLLGLVAAVAAVSTALAGCSSLESSGPSASGGTLAGVDLSGQTYNVAGKQFTEQLVLCQLSIAALQAAKATANDKCGFGGSSPVRAALAAGEVDLYWEYTGTGWITHLKKTEAIPDNKAQFDAVKQADVANGVTWLDAAPFENTYALAVKTDTADRLGVKTLSDFAKLVNSGSPEATLCVAQEFAGRDDGLPGLAKKYGFTIPPANLKTLDEGPIYQATANGDPCKFGEVFYTDGRIPRLGLTLLTDDQSFFPKYNGAVTIKTSSLDKNPKVADVFNPISAKLTNEVMRDLNGQVDQDGKNPRDVARAWLAKEGFISGP